MADFPSKQIFAGATTTVISHAATLANGANTYSGLTGCSMTQLDNSSGLYTHARAVLSIPDTFAAAPTAGGTIDLYMTLDDVDGTSDETPLPAATDIDALATWVASWTMDNQDVAYIKPVIFSLLGVQKAQFYIKNNSGQQISYGSNPTLVKITPFSVGVTV